MSANKTQEQMIVEKHIKTIHAGFNKRADGLFPPSPAMGDFRWTADLIISTYHQAEYGHPPENGLEYRIGKSDGGFDVLDLNFLPEDQWTPEDVEIDLSIPLNKRGFGQEIEIPIPIYGGGMS